MFRLVLVDHSPTVDSHLPDILSAPATHRDNTYVERYERYVSPGGHSGNSSGKRRKSWPPPESGSPYITRLPPPPEPPQILVIDTPPPPVLWTRHLGSNGRFYFYNCITGESTYTVPAIWEDAPSPSPSPAAAASNESPLTSEAQSIGGRTSVSESKRSGDPEIIPLEEDEWLHGEKRKRLKLAAQQQQTQACKEEDTRELAETARRYNIPICSLERHLKLPKASRPFEECSFKFSDYIERLRFEQEMERQMLSIRTLTRETAHYQAQAEKAKREGECITEIQKELDRITIARIGGRKSSDSLSLSTKENWKKASDSS